MVLESDWMFRSTRSWKVSDDVGKGIQIGRGPGFRRYWAWKSDRSS